MFQQKLEEFITCKNSKLYNLYFFEISIITQLKVVYIKLSILLQTGGFDTFIFYFMLNKFLIQTDLSYRLFSKWVDEF